MPAARGSDPIAAHFSFVSRLGGRIHLASMNGDGRIGLVIALVLALVAAAAAFAG